MRANNRVIPGQAEIARSFAAQTHGKTTEAPSCAECCFKGVDVVGRNADNKETRACPFCKTPRVGSPG
jgi:hypothetical protein